MSDLNILVNLPAGFFQTQAIQPLFERLDGLGTVRKTSHDTEEQIRDDLAWAEAVIMWSWPQLTDALLDSAPSLRYRGHLDIDQTQARIGLKRGIPISLSKKGWSPAVAEMALTLVLTTLRRTSDYHAAMRAGTERWVEEIPHDIDPTERQLTGRSVGIVGLGAIGRRLAELLEPFHCTLRVSDPFIPQAVIDQFKATRVEVDELIRQSEVVVLCAANNPGTQHMIGAQQIALFQENAVLVNVARAALVDTQALIARLEQGDLFAAVDVFDQEPLAADAELRRLPNAFLSPHRAGGVMESVGRVVGWLIDDLEAVLAGEERKHALTEAMLPMLDG